MVIRVRVWALAAFSVTLVYVTLIVAFFLRPPPNIQPLNIVQEEICVTLRGLPELRRTAPECFTSELNDALPGAAALNRDRRDRISQGPGRVADVEYGVRSSLSGIGH